MLFAGLNFVTRRRVGILFVAIGYILGFYSLLSISLQYDDFLPRCSPFVECSSVLAISIASSLRELGFLLAVAAFFFGLGLGLLASPDREGKDEG